MVGEGNIKRLTPRPYVSIEYSYTESLDGVVYMESLHGENDVRAEPIGGSHSISMDDLVSQSYIYQSPYTK